MSQSHERPTLDPHALAEHYASTEYLQAQKAEREQAAQQRRVDEWFGTPNEMYRPTDPRSFDFQDAASNPATAKHLKNYFNARPEAAEKSDPEHQMVWIEDKDLKSSLQDRRERALDILDNSEVKESDYEAVIKKAAKANKPIALARGWADAEMIQNPEEKALKQAQVQDIISEQIHNRLEKEGEAQTAENYAKYLSYYTSAKDKLIAKWTGEAKKDEAVADARDEVKKALDDEDGETGNTSDTHEAAPLTPDDVRKLAETTPKEENPPAAGTPNVVSAEELARIANPPTSEPAAKRRGAKITLGSTKWDGDPPEFMPGHQGMPRRPGEERKKPPEPAQAPQPTNNTPPNGGDVAPSTTEVEMTPAEVARKIKQAAARFGDRTYVPTLEQYDAMLELADKVKFNPGQKKGDAMGYFVGDTKLDNPMAVRSFLDGLQEHKWTFTGREQDMADDVLDEHMPVRQLREKYPAPTTGRRGDLMTFDEFATAYKKKAGKAPGADKMLERYRHYVDLRDDLDGEMPFAEDVVDPQKAVMSAIARFRKEANKNKKMRDVISDVRRDNRGGMRRLVNKVRSGVRSRRPSSQSNVRTHHGPLLPDGSFYADEAPNRNGNLGPELEDGRYYSKTLPRRRRS